MSDVFEYFVHKADGTAEEREKAISMLTDGYEVAKDWHDDTESERAERLAQRVFDTVEAIGGVKEFQLELARRNE